MIILVVVCINFSQNVSSCLICDMTHTVQNLLATVVIKLWQCVEKTQIMSARNRRLPIMCYITAAHSSGLQSISQYHGSAQPHFI